MGVCGMSDLFKSCSLAAPVTAAESQQPPSVTEAISQEFSWRSHEDIVCHRQPKTACYRNVNDMVVIRQQSDEYDDQADPVLVFDHATVPKLIRALAEQIDQNGELFAGIHDALWKHGL